jgi:DNA helicase-2/ATP-dependent DNA helicase PcrA
VAEFFRNRKTEPPASAGDAPSALDRLKAAGTPKTKQVTPHTDRADISPGTYVKHEKYGQGLVLRREGSGDNAKLTVSFPGFGQKKLIEKYANLEKV